MLSSSSIMAISTSTFLVMTLAYSVIRYFTRNTGSKTSYGLTLIYTLLVLGSQFVILGFLTKSISGSFDWGSAALHGLIPWGILFTSIIIILHVFPGWKAPFSNTIGYLITIGLGVKAIFQSILKPGNEYKSDPKLSRIMENIYEDESLMINTFTPSNFDDKIREYKGVMKNELKNASPSDIAFAGLKKLVFVKDIVSELLWLVLTGLLIINMSSMQVVSSKPLPSVSALEAGDTKYAEQMKKQHQAKQERASKATIHQITD